MDDVLTNLTSPDANTYFGTDRLFCDSRTLETVLRYAAIKSSGGDVEKAQLIPVVCSRFDYGADGNRYVNFNGEDDFGADRELLILTPPRKDYELPTVSKEGWTSLDAPPYPVAALLTAKSSETHIYINTTLKKAVIFVRTVTPKWCELLAACLIRVLPWRFAGDNDDLELTRAISKDDAVKYTTIVDKCVAGFDFKSASARRCLLGWANGYKADRIRYYNNKMSETMAAVRTEESRIANLLNTYSEYNTALTALVSQPEDANEFYNFFNEHKQLSIYKVETRSGGSGGGKTLYYNVVDTIEYYDEDEFDRQFKNCNSPIGGTDANTKAILKGLFKDRKGVVRVQAVFALTNLSSLQASSGLKAYDKGTTCLPHPHLVHYGCLGGNGTYINSFMAKGDWDLAIEQSIAAVKNLNMSDVTVVNAFISDLKSYSDSKCILIEDGRALTPNEFLAYLKQDNEQNGDTANG